MTVGNGSARHLLPGGWEPTGPAVFPAGWIAACEMVHRINDASAPWRERLRFTFDELRAESPLLSASPESLLADYAVAPKAAVKAAPKAAPVPEPPAVEAPPVRRVAARSFATTAPTNPTA